MEDSKSYRIPAHVAVIMDGNGRWAKSRNLSRTQGHVEGVKRVEEIIVSASSLGIKVLTLFTFSTENWRRPKNEVNILMTMITSVLNRKINLLMDQNVRFNFIGRVEGSPDQVLHSIKFVQNETKSNTGMILNMAFNYGGRLEIIDAIKRISDGVKKGALKINDITEERFGDYLYTAGLPDPDLLIRTSGEKRISNFLLWQSSYAELYFTDKFWPEFDTRELKKALLDYQNRDRRYGKTEMERSDK